MDNFHSKVLSKMHHLQTRRGAELLNKWNLFVESKQSSDSKMCISGQNPESYGGLESFNELKKVIDKMYAEELLKVQKNRIHKVKTVESNIKPITQSKKFCFCSPTSHEGSFRCRYHRISAAKRAVTANKSSLSINSKLTCDSSSSLSFNSKRNRGHFKPMLSRFGRAACSEALSHDSLIQQSSVDSA